MTHSLSYPLPPLSSSPFPPLSSSLFFSLSSIAPEGLAAPMLTLLNATTLLVQWSPPSHPNGLLTSYQLTLTNSSVTLVQDAGLETSAIINNLQPFTFYEVFVTVNNTVGSVDSPVVNITTGETGKWWVNQNSYF